MIIIETLALFFTLLCSWLTGKNNIWGWIVGIISIILFGYIFYNSQTWGNLGLQFVFLSQSIYGLWMWGKEIEVEITNTSNKEGIIYLTFVCFLTLLLVFISNKINLEFSYIDYFTTSLSLVAMYMMAKRKIEGWFVWLFTDILYIYMFLNTTNYILAILYFFLLLLSVRGFLIWKNLKNEKI